MDEAVLMGRVTVVSWSVQAGSSAVSEGQVRSLQGSLWRWSVVTVGKDSTIGGVAVK